MSVFLGTLAITSGSKTTFPAPPMGVKAILIGNESGLTCIVTMENGNVQKTLYPSTLDWFAVKPGFNGNILINPTSILNNVSTFPSSSLVFDAIGLDDSEAASMYPVQLSRNTNVGNVVNTTGGSTTSVTNDNQTLGTQFIESTPTGAASSTVSISNDGTVTIKGDVANVLTTLLQLIPGAASGASSVILADATRVTEILGNLQADKAIKGKDSVASIYQIAGYDTTTAKQLNIADSTAGILANILSNTKVNGTLETTGAATLDSTLGVTGTTTLAGATATSVSSSGHIDITVNNTTLRMKDSGGTMRDVLYVDAANATDLQGASTTINVKDNAGTTLVIINSTGLQLQGSGNFVDCGGSNSFKFANGNTQSRIGVISGTGSGTVNHGLGGAPDWLGPICTAAASSATQGFASVTSTQVTITMGAAVSWKAYEIKG